MTSTQQTTRSPWNHGRIIGQKLPLKPKHICAVRTRLQHDSRIRAARRKTRRGSNRRWMKV
jgi:hypothetical protein